MTTSKKIEYLIERAQGIMHMSTDPVHDFNHVTRVVEHTKKLSTDFSLTSSQKQALVLAAWWHDASRVMTKRPSFIMMPLVDDLLSALLLWRETIRCGLFGSVAGMATRIIFCKSFGAGRFLTRILIRKRNRVMIDILKDADTLDLLHTTRMTSLLSIAERSIIYERGYKFMIWWFLRNKQFYMKTKFGRKHIPYVVEEFLIWLEEPDVLMWHVERFGKEWLDKNKIVAGILLQKISVPNS